MTTREVRVLLIDAKDEEATQLRAKLDDSKNVTFAVQTVRTLSGGIALLNDRRFDAVLVDLTVPDSQGIESLKGLLIRMPEIPLIVINSEHKESEALETVRAGAQDYVVKKFLTASALERVLLYCMERQRGRTRTTMRSLVLRALAESEKASDARFQILKILCESLEYDFGQAWTLGGGSEKLVAAESWHNDLPWCEELKTLHQGLRLEKGRGLAGRVWETSAPIWVADFAQNPPIDGLEARAPMGVRSAVAFPILVGPEILGVIQLLSKEARDVDEELLTLAAHIGNEIGQFAARKRTEEEKQHIMQERLLILDSASEGIYGIDLKGCITFMNRSAGRMLGCAPAEVNGKKSHALFHHMRPDGRMYPIEECPTTTVLATGLVCRSDMEYFWKIDGSSISVDYSVVPVVGDGCITGAVVCFSDISERKKMEMDLRHAQKLESVGRLAAGIAHEINTPIQFVGDNTRFLEEALRQTVQMLAKYERVCEEAENGRIDREALEEVRNTRKAIDWPYLSQEMPKAMEQMLDGIDRVARIVRAMKEFSHGDHSPERTEADLNKALESTLVVARGEIKYVADVEVEYGKLPPVVCHLGDLNQVFLNLLINAAHTIGEAVKGTQDKGKIIVRTRHEDDWVEISVSDTGTGIPESIQDKIFDPFFTTKEVGKGTGQGLALARAIVVEKHGGTLSFETKIGKGTTFHIRLPVHGTQEPREALTR